MFLYTFWSDFVEDEARNFAGVGNQQLSYNVQVNDNQALNGRTLLYFLNVKHMVNFYVCDFFFLPICWTEHKLLSLRDVIRSQVYSFL